MSVEDLAAPVPANDPAPPAAPAVSADAPVSGALEPDDQPEGDPAKSFVPLAAVHAERSKAKALREQVDTLTSQVQQVGQLQQEVQRLQQHIAQQPKPPAPPPAPMIADEVADALARKFELYDGTGAPDRQRARDVAGFFAGLAEQEAKKAVAPLAELSAQERAQHFQEKAASVKDVNGHGVDPQILKMMFDVVPPAIRADPQVAGVLTYAAAGWERFHGKKGAPAAPETSPVFTERAGGRSGATPILSEWENNMLERMGRDKTEYLKSLKTYKPGQENVLE